jgi:GT2 family glycosyltransferase
MNASVDVIIPTYRREKQIQLCLDSIIAQSVKPKFIIIVDASESGDLGDVIQKKYINFGVKYIRSEKGASRQRNLGTSLITSDYVLFLDDDIELKPDFIAQLLKEFEKYPTAGAITGKIINDHRNYRVNPLLILFQRIFYLSESRDGKLKKSGERNVVHPKINDLVEVDCALGGLTMFKSEVFRDYSFDLNYETLDGRASKEDQDISLQLKHKYKIYYSARAKAYHYHKSSPGTRISKYKLAQLRAFNHRYFYNKHRDYYKLLPIPHFLSCAGMLIDSIFNQKSFDSFRGLVVGFFSYSFKKKGFK